MELVLGKNCLNWCMRCNMAVVSSSKCPKCGSKAEPVNVSPPWDLRPASKLEIKKIKELADETYGKGCGIALIPDDRTVIMNDKTGDGDTIEIVMDGAVIGLMKFKYDMKWHLSLSLFGFSKIFKIQKHRKAICNRDGSFFLRSGKNLVLKGVESFPGIGEIGDKVSVVDQKGNLIASGVLKMDPSELGKAEKGVFVKLRENKNTKGYHGKAHTNWQVTVDKNSKVIEDMVKDSILFMKRTIRSHPELPYAVSFSGGKDSQAVLMLCFDGKLKPVVMFADTGLEFPATVDFVNMYASLHNIDIKIISASFESFLTNMKTFGPPAEGYRWCCKTNKLNPIAKLNTELFPNGCLQFIGQRRYESANRMRTGRIWENPWFKDQISASPIQEWNALHVWMYIMLRKEPYNAMYMKGNPRVGCMLCPFASLPEIESGKGMTEKYDRWMAAIEDYGKKRGMPPEWTKYHLWRYRKLPIEVYNQVAPLSGKTYEELTKRTLPPERPPLKMSVQEGISPCVLGYSVEAALSRAIDLDRMEGFAHILNKEVKLEKGSHLEIGNLTIYAEGAMISKGADQDKIKYDLRRTFEILVRSEECCGCGQCTIRCPTGALTIVDNKVEIDASLCKTCGSCLCPCPSVLYTDD